MVSPTRECWGPEPGGPTQLVVPSAAKNESGKYKGTRPRGPMPHRSESDAFWKGPLGTISADLKAGPAGLTSAEAAASLGSYGPNLLGPRKERALLVQFLARFTNPLVLLLLVASAIAGATGDITSCVVITCMVALSV